MHLHAHDNTFSYNIYYATALQLPDLVALKLLGL